jgi:LTXXQ motif family protein
MVRSSVVALIATLSIGTLYSAPDAFARGGGHFGGGHFGGAREFRGGGERELRRPEEFRREERPREEGRGREEEHHDAEHRSEERHEDAHREDARRDVAEHDHYNHPYDNGHWDHWGQNAFWNDRWGGHNWNCPNCRLGWARGVFWPYGWGDMFSWAWWPNVGVPAFWGYGAGFIMSSLFWPYGAYTWPDNTYGAYAYSPSGMNYEYARESHEDIYSGGPEIIHQDTTSTADACAGFAPGVASLPMSKIEETVKPDKQQIASFDALSTASAKAEAILKASCSNDPALTPVGRLDELQKRLSGMTEALDTVKQPLIAFTDELSSEQKQRLDGMAQGQKSDADLCSDHDEQFTDVPAQQIEAAVKPDEKQQVALGELKSASTKASQLLKGACPSGTPQSTSARLDAMSKRLTATKEAMNDVRPALIGFYDSLSDEQKARFNTIPPQQAGK